MGKANVDIDWKKYYDTAQITIHELQEQLREAKREIVRLTKLEERPPFSITKPHITKAEMVFLRALLFSKTPFVDTRALSLEYRTIMEAERNLRPRLNSEYTSLKTWADNIVSVNICKLRDKLIKIDIPILSGKRGTKSYGLDDFDKIKLFKLGGVNPLDYGLDETIILDRRHPIIMVQKAAYYDI